MREFFLEDLRANHQPLILVLLKYISLILFKINNILEVLIANRVDVQVGRVDQRTSLSLFTKKLIRVNSLWSKNSDQNRLWANFQRINQGVFDQNIYESLLSNLFISWDKNSSCLINLCFAWSLNQRDVIAPALLTLRNWLENRVLKFPLKNSSTLKTSERGLNYPYLLWRYSENEPSNGNELSNKLLRTYPKRNLLWVAQKDHLWNDYLIPCRIVKESPFIALRSFE